MRPKALLLLSLALMLTPSFLYWFGPLRRPAMVDGDQLTMLACPQCKGADSKERCRRCFGKKVVQGIIPSPERPTIVVGHVYGPDAATPVSKAKVTFNSSAGSWSRETDEEGRFGADLPPGKYPLQIEAPAGKLTTTLIVEPQVAPSPVDQDPRFPVRHDTYTLGN